MKTQDIESIDFIIRDKDNEIIFEDTLTNDTTDEKEYIFTTVTSPSHSDLYDDEGFASKDKSIMDHFIHHVIIGHSLMYSLLGYKLGVIVGEGNQNENPSLEFISPEDYVSLRSAIDLDPESEIDVDLILSEVARVKHSSSKNALDGSSVIYISPSWDEGTLDFKQMKFFFCTGEEMCSLTLNLKNTDKQGITIPTLEEFQESLNESMDIVYDYFEKDMKK